MLRPDENERMTRALLTDGERAAIRGDEEMAASTRSSHLSRVRKKIPRLREDAEILRRNDPDLYEDVRDAVVGEELNARLSVLEKEVQKLRDRLEEAEDE